tara:strand:- start:8217 stop:8981 length:765 start_codon:yes stop_codon:yes gene_type:complete
MPNNYFNISVKDLSNWNELGFLLRPGHLKNYINDLNISISKIENLRENNRESLFYYEKINKKIILCRIEKFLKDNKFLSEIILGNKILGFVSELINKPAYLYKEKINIKPIGGAGYSAHQDATAYHKLKGHITCLVALTEMTLDNGCLYISEEVKNDIIPYDKDGCITKKEEKKLKWIPILMKPGDCLFFNSFVPHKSNKNFSSEFRKAIYLTFNDAEDGDLRSNYYLERSKTLEENKNRISTIGHFQGKNYKV